MTDKPITPAQRSAAEKRLRSLLQEPKPDLDWYYQVGEAVSTIAPPDVEVHYGTGQMARLIRRFRSLRPGLSPLFYSTRHLVSVYRRSDLRRLRSLPWSHVARLASVADPKVRTRLERRCLAEGWTYLQLRSHYAEELGVRPSGGSKAKPIRDAGTISALRETVRLTDQWLHAFEQRLHSSKSHLAFIPERKHTPELRHALSQARMRLIKLRNAAERGQKEIQALCEKVRSTLRKNRER
jgi:hypothetical protein